MSNRGSATLEMTILAPALLAILLLVIFAGRISMAHQSVNAAAAAAARTASIARTASSAKDSATSMAEATLANQQLGCTAVDVLVDTAPFKVDVGRAATVTTTVTCQVSLADLTTIGVPGSMTISAQASSPLDTYRERK